MFKDSAREMLGGVSHKLGITFSRFGDPNFYTILTLLAGFGAAYAIFLGKFILGIGLIMLSGFFDWVDGSVARAIQGTTKWGAMADSVTDKVTEIAIYFALGLYSSELFLGAMLAISAFMLSSYISKHAGALGARHDGGLLERKERIFIICVGLVAIYSGTQYMAFALYAIAALSAVTAVQRLNRSWKEFKAL